MSIGQQNLRGGFSLRSALPENGMYLHASAVIVNGGGVLFLGHSTSGKSTIARLLSPLWPMLADDTVLVKKDDKGQWRVTDGKNRLTNSPPTIYCPPPSSHYQPLTTIPLHSCIRIHKGTDVRHEPLASIELAQCLMDAVMEVDVQRKCGRLDPKDPAMAPDEIAAARTMRERWFAQTAEIARDCQGMRLWFPCDADPRELVAAIGSRGSGRLAVEGGGCES